MFSIAVIGVGTFLGECGVFARRAWGRGRGFLLRDDGEGSASNATAAWAAKLGMNLQNSTLKFDETGEPFHVQQAAQIRAFRAAWKEAGHARTPRVSVSRSIFALLDDRDRAYFGRGGEEQDNFGFIDEK